VGVCGEEREGRWEKGGMEGGRDGGREGAREGRRERLGIGFQPTIELFR